MLNVLIYNATNERFTLNTSVMVAMPFMIKLKKMLEENYKKRGIDAKIIMDGNEADWKNNLETFDVIFCGTGNKVFLKESLAPNVKLIPVNLYALDKNNIDNLVRKSLDENL